MGLFTNSCMDQCMHSCSNNISIDWLIYWLIVERTNERMLTEENNVPMANVRYPTTTLFKSIMCELNRKKLSKIYQNCVKQFHKATTIITYFLYFCLFWFTFCLFVAVVKIDCFLFLFFHFSVCIQQHIEPGILYVHVIVALYPIVLCGECNHRPIKSVV